MTRDVEGVEAIVRRVPAWAHARLEIRPINVGMADRAYVVRDARGDAYVVRLPGERTGLLGIDRANEVEAATRAAALGIGAPVRGALPGVGTLITELVPGHPASPDRLADRLDDVVGLLRRLHGSGPLAGSFPIHRVVEWHARDAGAHGIIAPSSYERLHQQSRRIERAFAAAPTPPVPCHNDLVPANVLVGEDRAWLLAFAHAGMNDVFFDLANLSVNHQFSASTDERLLARYFGDVSACAWARLQLMKVMSEFREGMRAVVQQAISTLDRDFAAYADERLRHCEHLAASPDVERWLEDARRPVAAPAEPPA